MGTQFVDDSTLVITFKDTNQTKINIESYFSLLYTYYNANKLKLNPDKTQFMISCNNKTQQIFKNFYITVNNFKIKPLTTIKILGTYIQQDLKWDKEISTISSNLHNRIN